MKSDRRTRVINKTMMTFYALSIFLIQLTIFGNKIKFISLFKDYMLLLAVASLLVIIIIDYIGHTIKLKKILFSIILIILGFISAYVTESTIMLQIILLLLASGTMGGNGMVRTDLVVKILLFMIIVMLYSVGLTDSIDYETRKSFGFGHPNTLGFILVTILYDFCYLNRQGKKKSIAPCIVAYVICLSFIIASGSRTALVFSSLCIAYFVITSKLKSRIAVKKKRIIMALPSILLIISVFFTFNYIEHGPYYLQIDEALSGRTYLQSIYYKQQKISLFGNNINRFREKYFLDNAYYRYIYNFGIYGIVTMIIIYSYAIKKTNNKDMLFIITCMLFYGLSEFHALRPTLNPYISAAIKEEDDDE